MKKRKIGVHMLGILSLVQNNVSIVSAQQKKTERMALSTMLWIYLLWLFYDQFHSLCSSNFLMMVSR